MAGKRRFRGPGGGVFVPHRSVDEATINVMVKSGEWTPLDGPVEGKPAPTPQEGPAEQSGTDGGAVPDGTVADVMGWVGDDPGRARQALDVETGKGERARTTLVNALTGIAGGQ